MNRSFFQTLLLTFLAIAALFVIDTFLAKVERAEDRTEAAHRFRDGQNLVAQGHYSDAVGPLSDAASIERDNRDYRLALAEVYRSAGRSADAEDTLAELLREDSTDGAANLAMARVLLQEGRDTEGISFYHRAIYGHWKDHAAENKVRVRTELVDLLARQNAKEDLLAELLPLEEEAPDDLATRERIGRLFIAAGSYSHADEVFRDILRRHPQDADAYSGLGEAEASRRNYQTARADFATAARLKPQDETIRSRLDWANQILELDPTQRGLDTAERYRRSVRLLQLVADDAKSCGMKQTDVLASAAQSLKQKTPEARQSAVTESNLDLAEQLWQLQRNQCPPTPAAMETPQALVLAKIGQ